jgi:hypothetical protein
VLSSCLRAAQKQPALAVLGVAGDIDTSSGSIPPDGSLNTDGAIRTAPPTTGLVYNASRRFRATRVCIRKVSA